MNLIETIATKAVIGYGAMQKVSELTKLLEILNQHQPKVVVEIGSFGGGTILAFSQAITEPKIISIDNGSLDARYNDSLKRAISSVNGFWLQLDSQNPETVKELQKLLNGTTVNFLFIDGNHTYEAVKKDFELYSPLVCGIIAFHDIVPHPAHGVAKFWGELKDTRKYKTQEIVLNPQEGKNPHEWGGIGVLYT